MTSITKVKAVGRNPFEETVSLRKSIMRILHSGKKDTNEITASTTINKQPVEKVKVAQQLRWLETNGLVVREGSSPSNGRGRPAVRWGIPKGDA